MLFTAHRGPFVQFLVYLIHCVWRCIGRLMAVSIVVVYASYRHVRAHPTIVHAVKQIQSWTKRAHSVVALSANLEGCKLKIGTDRSHLTHQKWIQMD